MGNAKTPPSPTAQLRRRAEARLETRASETDIVRAGADARRLLHELAVYRVELEMQNEELRRARGELKADRERHAHFYDFSPVGYATLDRQGSIRALNLTAADFLGKERSRLIGRRLGLFVLDKDIPAFTAFLARVFASGEAETCELQLLKNSRSPLPVQIQAVALQGRDECHVTLVDITGRKPVAEQLASTRNRVLEMLVDGASLPELLETIVRGVEAKNPAVRCSILLLDKDDKRLLKGVAPNLPDFFSDALHELEIGPGVISCGSAAYTGERVVVENIAKHSNWVSLRALAAQAELGACWSEPIKAADHKVQGTFAIYHRTAQAPTAQDIELMKSVAHLCHIAIEHTNLHDQLMRLAHYDMLTDLPNRTLFFDRLHLAMAQAKREQRKLALMFLDLDRFKPINDLFGHTYGDSILKEVAKRLLDCVRDSDTVARFGGDEFVLLLPKFENTRDITVVAKKALEAIRQPLELIGPNFRISTSIGIALYPDHGDTENQLITNADVAMYQAKKAHRKIQFYRSDLARSQQR